MSDSPQNATLDLQEPLSPELNTAPDGIGLTEPHTEPSPRSPRLRVYVAALLLAPFLYMLICFFVMRSDFFLRRTQNVYLGNMGYGLQLKNADCQVLIYGDSSAMVGVDPHALEQSTGLSACNIADYAGMLRLNGTMVLDTYLAHNPRPRYLVFLLAPEDLTPAWRHDGNYEAVLMRVREHPDAGLLYAAIRHGEDVLSAIGISGRYALTWLVQRPPPASSFHQREATLGRFPDPKGRMDACTPDFRVSPPDRPWVDAFRARYSGGGTRVLVDVVPVPACDPALSTYSRQLAPGTGIIDNRLKTYPISWYTESGRLHLGSPEGWGHLTAEVAAQINQLQHTGR